jgi:DNA-binding transcriptional ArsR family regulator
MEFEFSSYIAVMPAFVHPDLKDVCLSAALHALADPTRLEIVAALASCCDQLNSSASCPGTPKSTLSNHLTVLRAAGIVKTEAKGRDRMNRLRREEFDARFPGLLDTVLANRD